MRIDGNTISEGDVTYHPRLFGIAAWAAPTVTELDAKSPLVRVVVETSFCFEKYRDVQRGEVLWLPKTRAARLQHSGHLRVLATGDVLRVNGVEVK